MLNLVSILEVAKEKGASDIFIISGQPVSFKIGAVILPIDDVYLKPLDTSVLINQIYELEGVRTIEQLMDGDDDFSFSIPDSGRFRCCAYKQRGSYAAVIRIVSTELPDYKKLGIPESVMELYNKNRGLVLITGPAGSGKSTTLSVLIDRMNKTKNNHVITIEDPIEYLHKHDKCIVSQREVTVDTENYLTALRAALRQAPNVILLGEMRDYETIATAITAAETGQLVLSTLHTVGAANTIDRIIDVFPPLSQQQIRIQLSMVLEAVVSQQLIPTVDGKLVPAFEILKVNSAVRNLIRESKIHQIDNVILSSGDQGMTTMDNEIFKLYKSGIISRDSALLYCTNYDTMSRKLNS